MMQFIFFYVKRFALKRITRTRFLVPLTNVIQLSMCERAPFQNALMIYSAAGRHSAVLNRF